MEETLLPHIIRNEIEVAALPTKLITPESDYSDIDGQEPRMIVDIPPVKDVQLTGQAPKRQDNLYARYVGRAVKVSAQSFH